MNNPARPHLGRRVGRKSAGNKTRRQNSGAEAGRRKASAMARATRNSFIRDDRRIGISTGLPRIKPRKIEKVPARGVTHLFIASERRITPEPVIGPRFARTRWAPIRATCYPLRAAAIRKTAGPAEGFSCRAAPAPPNLRYGNENDLRLRLLFPRIRQQPRMGARQRERRQRRQATHAR
jgi:hypothetical protein